MCYTESYHLAGRLLCRTGEFKAAKKTRRSGPGSGGLVNPDGGSRAQVCQNRLSVLRATAQREKKLGATRSSKPAKSVGQYRRGHSRRVIRGKYPQLVQPAAQRAGTMCVGGWLGGGHTQDPKCCEWESGKGWGCRAHKESGFQPQLQQDQP